MSDIAIGLSMVGWTAIVLFFGVCVGSRVRHRLDSWLLGDKERELTAEVKRLEIDNAANEIVRHACRNAAIADEARIAELEDELAAEKLSNPCRGSSLDVEEFYRDEEQ